MKVVGEVEGCICETRSHDVQETSLVSVRFCGGV